MCGHRVQFYENEAFLLRKVLDFISPGLHGGGSAVVIATQPHLRRLRRWLDDVGGDGVQDPMVPGLFIGLDARETLERLMVDGQPDPERFDAVIGGLLQQVSEGGTRRVSAFGEMVALLYADGNAQGAVRLEHMWESLAERCEFGLLCAYPMTLFPDATHAPAFRAICQAHSHVDPLEHVGQMAGAADLHRTIAHLQQKANSLQRELARRRLADRTLNRQAERICEMERAQAALQNLAGQDTLTGLPNRRVFTDRLAHALEIAKRTQTCLALIFVDLDDFKGVNDRFGHEAGDRLLIEVAARLGRCVRASDTVSRLGGDEFVVLMEGSDAAEAAHLAQRIVDAIAAPVSLSGEEVTPSASLGISLSVGRQDDPRALLRRADEAMYRAKKCGKGRYLDSEVAPLQ